MPVSPDCRDGNHRKCYGDAWDVEADAATVCGCGCHAVDARDEFGTASVFEGR